MTWWVLTHMRPYPRPTSLSIAATTNNPDHLFMAWSYTRPKRSRILRKIRGKWVFCGYLYYWDTPNIAEQIEPGDTLGHHFHLPNLTPLSTIWFYLNAPAGPYGLEIQGPLSHITLPPAISWANNLMVATKEKGIYITPNFSGPEGPHPTWTRHNQRLLSLNIIQLHGDLWQPAFRQFALVAVNGTSVLYKREPAAGDFWQWILTTDQALALTGAPGGDIQWVTTNLNRPGFIYVYFQSSIYTVGNWLLRSPDYGASWTAFWMNMPAWTNAVGNIVTGRAQGTSEHSAGNVLYATQCGGAITRSRLYASTDHGATWNLGDEVTSNVASPRCQVDPTDQSIVYMGDPYSANPPGHLLRSQEHGENLADIDQGNSIGINVLPWPTYMWIHPTNHAFMKILANDHMWQSWDYCATWEDLGETMVHVEHLHIPDLTPAFLHLGRDESCPLPPDLGWPHVVLVSDDHGATMIGKCGAHAQQSDGGGDSIPWDCGGIAREGILPLY